MSTQDYQRPALGDGKPYAPMREPPPAFEVWVRAAGGPARVKVLPIACTLSQVMGGRFYEQGHGSKERDQEEADQDV
jgi:hypothetical protein